MNSDFEDRNLVRNISAGRAASLHEVIVTRIVNWRIIDIDDLLTAVPVLRGLRRKPLVFIDDGGAVGF